MLLKNTVFQEKLKESIVSVLPITLIVLLLCFTVAPVNNSVLMAFILGAVLLIIGMGLFNMGVDMAMTPIGEYVGSSITKSKRLVYIILICFIMGFVITISEPDLSVLASQVPSIPNRVLILAVACGVGVFLVIAMLRILFSIRLSYLLVGFYILVFALSYFVPNDFVAIAFDSGGVTTGPMTVPFIMAFGVGIASIRSDKHAHNDSFGLVALCSVGPIIAVLILGLIYSPEASVPHTVAPQAADSKELWSLFMHGFPEYTKEVTLALLPIVVIFIIMQLVMEKLPKNERVKIVIGLIYTFIGLIVFLTGVNVGFLPVGNYLGQVLAGLSYNWIIVPIGMVIGYFAVNAEPAVHVLSKQVKEMTDGLIPEKVLLRSMSVSVAAAVGMSMVRVLTGISIYAYLVPGYAIALILTGFAPRIFTSIAFDSGGVATGPMTATFLLPLAMGACEAIGGNIVTDAFGIIATVAMMPLITIQILGVTYQQKIKRAEKRETAEHAEEDIEIIEL